MFGVGHMTFSWSGVDKVSVYFIENLNFVNLRMLLTCGPGGFVLKTDKDKQVVVLGLIVVCGILVIKSNRLVSLLIRLEGFVLVFLACMSSGYLGYWGVGVLLFYGVVIGVVVITVALGTYVARVRNFGPFRLCVSSLGIW